MRKEGYVIAIDGMDGAGKETQTHILSNALIERGHKVVVADFPNYPSDSSALVKRYLKGEYNPASKHVTNITFVRQMSSFYAVDRVSTFMETMDNGKSLMEMYNEGYIILCNRYTSASILHQSANLEDKTKGWAVYFADWVDGLERQLGLPRADLTIILDVHPDRAVENIRKRYAGAAKEDILENIEHLSNVYELKDILIDHFKWSKIKCDNDELNEMRSVLDISTDILELVTKCIAN